MSRMEHYEQDNEQIFTRSSQTHGTDGIGDGDGQYESRRSDRAKRDAELKPEIVRVFEDLSVYGVLKIWHQMRAEGFGIARCTVARLMKELGIEGVIRGKMPRTTFPDKGLACPLDRVNRQFHAPAPNILWVSDFIYLATWQGFVYVAFVIDVFARQIGGWRASTERFSPSLLSMSETAFSKTSTGTFSVFGGLRLRENMKFLHLVP